MASPNIEMLKIVAKGLEELNQRVVYVGGAVTELYATDPAATEIRPTIDIDCVIELASYSQLSDWEDSLRKKGFENDRRKDAPLCRWLYAGIVVDIMPDDEQVLQFTNRWYKGGMAHRQIRKLSNDIFINIFPVEYYLATKIEAVYGRGGSDLRGNHDFEDIIYILNSCNNLKSLIDTSSDFELKEYLKDCFGKFLQNPNIMEVIECALPLEEGDRAGIIYDLMLELSF